MRIPVSAALVSAVALAVSIAPATAAPLAVPTKAPGRTLTITVAGLPTSALGKVVVTGPGSYRTVVRANGQKRLAGLRSGKYTLKAKAVSTSFGKAKVKKKKTRTVKVTAKKGATVLVLYVTPGTS